MDAHSDGSHYEKRGNGGPVRIDDEIPFEIPESWEWARIETVSTDPRYGTSAKSHKTGAFPVLRMGNITKDGGLDYSNLVFTSDENEIETYRLFPGAVIFNRTNSREWVGKTAYYDGSIPAAYAGYLIAFYPILLSGEYVNYAMCAPYERDWCKRVKSDGINQSNINSQKLKSFLLPVPPREEQNRIVNLINEVMPYISQYDALENARGHLDAELLGRLRRSILQMAVQGRLVEQNQDDEPACVLLERIRKERAALVKAKKLRAPKGGESVIYRASDGGYYEKRGKGEPVCIDDEIPFEIPEGWAWARLGSIVLNRVQVKPASEFCYIDIGSIDNTRQKLNDEETVIAAKDAPSRARKPVEMDDVLYSTVRPYLHNACIVDRGFSYTPIASTGFAAMVCPAGFSEAYLLRLLISPFFDSYANDNENAKGVAYPAINDARLYNALVPVPPSNEQTRIVSQFKKLEDSIG